MAKRSQKKRGGRRPSRGEDRPEPAHPDGPAEPPKPTEPPPGDPGWDRALRIALGLACAIGGVLALGATGLPSPGLWALGCLALAAAGAAALASTRAPSARILLDGFTLVAGTLGAAALIQAQPDPQGGAFAWGHETFVGAPTILAFAALSAAVSALRRRPGGGGATVLAVGAAIWATAALLLPDQFAVQHADGTWTQAVEIPALRAFSGPASSPAAALIALAGLTAVGAAWLHLGRRVRGLPDPYRGAPWRDPVHAGVLAAAGWHALRPLAVDPVQASSTGAGLALAAAAVLLAAVGHRLLLPAADPEAAARRWRRAAGAGDLLAPLVVTTLYLALKTHGMGPSQTDENIYFYMAWDLSEGRWPYVDYFFAHPPLHVLIPGAFFSVFGWSLTLAKLFSVGAGAVSGLAIWAIGRRHLGRIAGVVAMVAFLFAAETLKATTNMTGVNLTVMFLTLGLWQALRGRGLIAGLLFGAAASTGFYAMAAICAVAALAWFRPAPASPAPDGQAPPPDTAWLRAKRTGARHRHALGILGGFLLVWGGLNLAFLVAAGDAFVDGVYRYHGLKSIQDPRMVPLTGPGALLHNVGALATGRPFSKDLYYHTHLYAAACVAPLLAAVAFATDADRRARPWRFFDPRRLWDDGPHGVAGLVWLVGLALFIQFSMFRELYSFYFVLIYPVLALLVGYVAEHSVRVAAAALDDQEAGPTWRGVGAAGGVVAATLFALWVPWSVSAGAVFPEEAEQLGQRNEYAWKPAPVLPQLGALVRPLFWQDHRIKGTEQRGYRYYLWTKKRSFVTLPEIAAHVAAATTPDETIAGASTLAPLVALTAGRRLAAGEADTNSKRFKTGMLDRATFWDDVCSDDVRFLVAAPRSFFVPQNMARMPTPRRWFRQARRFDDPELLYDGVFPIYLFERTGTPPGDGRVCRYEGDG